jgi:hypothetical protein
MKVLNLLPEQIRIIECVGLGRAQPRGFIGAAFPADRKTYPQATLKFPRLVSLPLAITIKWENRATQEEFSQLLSLPANAKGAVGTLLFVLDTSNVWTCKLVDEHDFQKEL